MKKKWVASLLVLIGVHRLLNLGFTGDKKVEKSIKKICF
jgi:hypothetical protein